MATLRPAKAPAFQFYPGDWRRDVALQSCGLEARGLWWELLCLMHDGEPYGHLAIRGRAISDDRAAAMIGVSLPQFRRLLAELEEAGVSSRAEDGSLYSRRMVRDAQKRSTLAANGAAGGRQTQERGAARFVYAMQRTSDGAIKIGCSRDPVRRQETLSRNGAPLVLLAYARGSYDSEKRAHIELAAYALGGEWFQDAPAVRRWIETTLTEGAATGNTAGSTSGQASGPDGGVAAGPSADATAAAEADVVAGKQLTRLRQLLPVEFHAAFDGYLRTSRFQPAFIATVLRCAEPTTGGTAHPWPTIGAALAEMAGNGEAFNASRLAGYCRRIAAGPPPARPSTARGDGWVDPDELAAIGRRLDERGSR